MSNQRDNVNASDVESGRKEPFYFTINEVTRKELEMLKEMQVVGNVQLSLAITAFLPVDSLPCAILRYLLRESAAGEDA